jgi:hypothetical protein
VNQKPAFLRRLGILLLVGGLVAGVSTPAWAGPKDGEAKKLAESAIYEDYLNLQFDAAIAKLNQARDLCEDGCGRSVQATVYRDLGVVYFAGKEDKASALDYFKKAFQADPFVKLDEDLSSDEIKAVFEEARSAVGVPSSSSSDEGSGLTSSSATGSHNPPAEQTVETPVPLFMNASEDTDGVKLMYRMPGQDKFRSMGLRRYKNGWAGEVDCESVGNKTGTMEYYFIMYDEMGREAGRVGDEFDLFTLPIKTSISGRAPSLPDQSPPGSCKELQAADCPPGFPGCETYEDEDWAKAPKEDEDANAPSFWVTLGFQQDFLLLPQTSGACLSTSDYGCYYGRDYRDPYDLLVDGNNNPVAAGGFYQNSEAGVPQGGQYYGAGAVKSGFAMATQRILLGLDYAVTPSILIGVRGGFALGGGPAKPGGAAFIPAHAEARVAYWFTGAHSGVIRPYVQLGGGLAQVDARVTVNIVDSQAVLECSRNGTRQGTGCLARELNAWRKTGTVFGSAGLGALIATSKATGFILEGRGLFLLPESGISLSAQAGFTVGF